MKKSSKVTGTRKTGSFAKGGTVGMHGKMSAGTQVSGQTAAMGRSDSKFASGGKGHMAPKQSASKASPA